ncbi:MAG: YeeE/YedE family protein [Anaerolineae bacterium]
MAQTDLSTNLISEGGAASAALNSPPQIVQQAWRRAARYAVAVLVTLLIAFGVYALHGTQGYGAPASFSLLVGAALGVIFERGRFCFFCILRDYIQYRNSGGMFAIVTALAVGGIGYAIVFGSFLPNPFSGRLPPDAHIGPVSWVLVAAGFAFGIGMALSGACISGHLYRLGEGYTRAPLALFGALIGFGIGFFTWYDLYLNTLNSAPVAWLPATLGYGGSLALHLLVLGGIALILLRRLPELKALQGGKVTLQRIYQAIFVDRWNPLITGALVGLVGIFAYFRVEPLGVTAQLGSLSRTWLSDLGYLAERLPGLDTFAGCATIVSNTIGNNGFLIGGLVLGSLAIALFTNRFQLSQLTLRGAATALLGGVLMGWGSMVALGCTVGTLLSGISAFAVAGWVFFAAVFAGVWVGIKAKWVL